MEGEKLSNTFFLTPFFPMYDTSEIDSNLEILGKIDEATKLASKIIYLVTAIHSAALVFIAFIVLYEPYIGLVCYLAIPVGGVCVIAFLSEYYILEDLCKNQIRNNVIVKCVITAIIWVILFLFLWKITGFSIFGWFVTILSAGYLSWGTGKTIWMFYRYPLREFFPTYVECQEYLCDIEKYYEHPPVLSDFILEALYTVDDYDAEKSRLGWRGDSLSGYFARNTPFSGRLVEAKHALATWQDGSSEVRNWWRKAFSKVIPVIMEDIERQVKAEPTTYTASYTIECPSCGGKGSGERVDVEREHDGGFIELPMGSHPTFRTTVHRTRWTCCQCNGKGVIYPQLHTDLYGLRKKLIKQRFPEAFLARYQEELLRRWGQPSMCEGVLLEPEKDS